MFSLLAFFVLRSSFFVLLTSVVLLGCGKRGNPLPPLQRIPAAPGDFAVTRIDNDVYAQFTAPTVNADGVGPAAVARVELYAITAERPPDIEDPDDLRRLSTLVGTEQVRRPLVPPPPPKEGMPPIPLPPPGPGVDQGAVIVMREALTPEARVPRQEPSGERGSGGAPGVPAADLARPLIAPSATEGPQRFYFAVGVSPRGRYGPATHLAPAPLGPTSSAPPVPEIAVDEKAMTIRWNPPSDVRGAEVPTPPDLLPSRPIAPGPPPTTYDVYEVARTAAPANGTPTVPTPLTKAPVGALEFVQPGITLGTERCFVVRPVDILSGVHVRGPASPFVCASFADTFAPAPPGKLDVVAAPGAISLIWVPSPAEDLAGYIVLRGEGPDATLSPLMTDPLRGTTHTDNTVRPGARYIYAVMAIDKAGNRSAESNRVEETARQ
ncbi:MAG: hypothetical protein ACRD1H_13625 [Vicinamibacterales bacterium]